MYEEYHKEHLHKILLA